MSLAEIIGSTVGLTDLPALALALGFEPTWHQVALESIRIAAIEGTRAAVVGRRDGVVVIGLEGPAVERTARVIATTLARRGTTALVIAADPVARRLGFAPAAAECPVMVVATSRVRAIDLEVLDRARRVTGPTPLTRLLGWAEALSGRSLDDRFFRQFQATLAEAAGALPRPVPARDRHGLALLALTRVLFLYFVQARGWLDGRDRFLREELDLALASGGNVERRLFAPLFFGTLNTPLNRRTAGARRFGRVPFLNGGLFEPHPLERRWRAPLPDPIWRDGFDRLFERYHFTLSGADDPGAIGPDMLGRVFEGVMDPEVRRETGAFYTPARLVDLVVDRTLVHWLAGTIGGSPEDAAAVLGRPDAATLARLERIAVLDPAVGSGAFLLGVLRRLVAARTAAGQTRAAATRAVIATNLFGVDRNPNAVHLAELRLWLEVIEADGETEPERVEPLPNLDALIRQGDSVLERLDLPFVVASTPGDDLTGLRAAVVSATGAGKRAAVTALRRAELRAARAALDAAVDRAERRIGELLATGRDRSLFGDRLPLPRSARAILERARRERRQLRAARRRLIATSELPWFHYGSQFADVMGRGGFDLVVGNPPWVRAEALTAAEREALKRRFRWFRSVAGRRPGFAPLPDLSVAFLERGIELLASDGTLGFLVPAKITTAQYGGAVREALARTATLHVAADLETAEHGFDAVVYPLMLVIGRAAPKLGHQVATGPAADAARIPQESLGAAGWELRPAGRLERAVRVALDRLPTLADRFRIRLGVKTGADRCFLDPPATVERELVRPALRGRDIEPFRIRPVRRLLWTHDRSGRPRATLPPGAAAALAPHLRTLRARVDHRVEPAWTLFRIDAARGRFRVVWPDLSRGLEAAALISREEEAVVPLNTCYAIVTPDAESALAVAGWLNAEPIRRLAKRRATVAAAGFSRFNAELVGGLPFPEAALRCRRLIDLARSAVDGRVDQPALDAVVTGLLGAGS